MIEKSKLLTAVLKQDIKGVQENLLDCLDGDDPLAKDEEGRNYLHISVQLRNKALVQCFIDEGLDVNDSDHQGVTPLHIACRLGADKVVETLLSAGAQPNIKAKNLITPLHIAAGFGHTACVQLICSSGLDIDLDPQDSEDHTPLHYAAAEGHKQIVTDLIAAGSNANAVNVVGNTPMHFAAASGTPTVCCILHKSGKADIDAQNSKGQTPQHIATLEGCASSLLNLLNLHADPTIKDNKGNTCLHLAIKGGQIELVNILLLDPRTDPSISDDDENTVLHLALKLGHFNLIPMMLPRARDLTKQNSSGCTVIIEAIKNQLEEMAIEMLKACPSLVHTATFELVTPLHLAAERGMRDLTRELLIAGAQVDAADSTGLTPSLYCAKNDSVLECLAMIEDIMMVAENHLEENGHRQQVSKGNGKGSRISSRISS